MSWNRVAVVGAGLIKMGELFDQSYEQMAAGAFDAAVASVDKGFEPAPGRGRVRRHPARARSGARRASAATPIPTAIGLAGIPCTRIENACPSGSDAFRVGAMAVASGVHDVVLVIGVEKMRDKSTEEGLLSRAAAGHPIFTRGETAPVLFAPFATRHMHEFGTTREMLASVAVKNHYNGARDPYAHFQNEITVDDVLKSAPVCHPLHLLDCCPQTDGAAAVLLVPRRAGRTSSPTSPVYVAGFGVATDHPYLHEKDSFTEIKATRLAVAARVRDGRRRPGRHRLRRGARLLHDHRDPRHRRPRLLREGRRRPSRASRARPRSPAASRSTRRGGLLAKGHPIGATGVAQITECWWQLRGEAGERQVETRNGYALQHNAGGRGSGVAVVNILTTNRSDDPRRDAAPTTSPASCSTSTWSPRRLNGGLPFK